MLLAISPPASDLELTRKKSRARFDLTLACELESSPAIPGTSRRQSPFWRRLWRWRRWRQRRDPGIDRLQHAGRARRASVRQRADQRQPAGRGVVLPERHRRDAFENPLFITTNTIAGVPATTFTQGSSICPSNDYYNLKAEFARKFPKFLKSRVTGVFALGRSEQDDNLIPWAIDPLTGGTINGVSTPTCGTPPPR